MMFASFIGQLLSGVIIAFVFALFLVSALVGSLKDMDNSSSKNVEIKENSILHLTFSHPITDQEKNPEFSFGPGGLSAEHGNGLNTIKKQLKRAEKDDHIKGIFIEAGSIIAGMATTEELRNALLEFKKSGKFIYAYSEIYTHKAYYVASVADKIMLYPQGISQLSGLTAEVMFMKGLIEKLELDLTIIRGTNNKFKSAVEPLMYEKMSEANRLQVEKYLFSLWDHILTGISESRNIPVEKLNLLADSLMINNAAEALEHHLVDQITYKDEVFTELRTKIGIKESDDLNLVSISDYSNDIRLRKEIKKEEKENKNKPKIAVIYASGSIVDGKGDKNSIGSITLSEQIRAARLDTTIKAVVLRVNSPGGSALASDVIWRETILTKKVKPFIVSMGDVAASGGYYISCAADKIYAQPNTITGSIGVFGVLPNTSRMMKNKLGITYDRVTTNKYSDIGSVSRSMDDFEFRTIQKGVDDIYLDFTTKVAEGRSHTGLTQATVDSIGQGRVWAGTDALKIGLVDELGGLDVAILEAAKRANLTADQYVVTEYPIIKSPLEELLEDLKGDTKMKILINNFGLSPEMMLYLYDLNMLIKQKGIQAKMPYSIEIH